MKRLSAIIFTVAIIGLGSCAQHKVCPTYTKSTKHIKTESAEKI